MNLHNHIYRENPWLGLMIGNSRLHWALFSGETLDSAWDTDYLPESVIQQFAQAQTPEKFTDRVISQLNTIRRDTALSGPYPISLASVVPSQTAIWQTLPNVRIITLAQIPLFGVYPTLGIDRALALWGAGKTWGFPILVIDSGTALTFTGADDNQCLVGGAILPGLGLQFATLGQKTGQLPLLEAQLINSLPPRFALNTPEAIQSGVIYTLLAGIKDFIEAWLFLFPESKIAITGGDRILLKNSLQIQFPEIAARLIVEQNLIFWGMEKIVIEIE
ncbi:pantothenate kinase, type III [Cylindrospermum stagnale PCC 7417]|uniref:Type III pantothenate kinase n=2 Tax=Cylindrospermum stagnale TaxID=142864 RepID=K9X3F9_9NOST|nr:pantothenate kinase [Cylindrospermum stagnale]AFZ27180.1 pantothenate kinase, type III [Cylindrospermum stagnale PCC 7417]